MRLIAKGKIDHTSKTVTPSSLVARVHDSSFSVLTWSVVFSMESPKRVSCDAMTNVVSCLDENS